MTQQIAVAGLGRFGLFWAECLRDLGPVVGTSRRLLEDLPDGVRQVPLERLGDAETVFLCVAISSLETFLPRLAPFLRAGQVVIDTCSVKEYPVEQMLRHLPGEVDIIASHPMFGPDSARERAGRLPIIVHPVRGDGSSYDAWVHRFTHLGLDVIEMEPADHDKEAAYTQGIAHYVGRMLSFMDLEPSRIATLGYERLLQVMGQTCNDPEQLFRDLQRFNGYTYEMREKLRDARERTERLLDSP